MSKNVKILEDSAEKVLPDVAKIQTQLANGNKCYWVPEDEIPLGTLTVTQDGVYKASEDPNGPYYGYSQVTASGVGSISMGNLKELIVTENGIYDVTNESGGPYIGYSKVNVNVPKDKQSHTSSGTVGKDDDGDPAIAVVNPETGEIEVHKTNGMPTRIEVYTPPVKTEYVDGEALDYTGIVVKVYNENDELWTGYTDGIIPTTALVFVESVADINNADSTRVVAPGVIDPFHMWQIQLNVPYENQGTWHNPYTGNDDPLYRYFYELQATMPVYMVCAPIENGTFYTTKCVSLAAFSATSQRTTPSGWSPQTSTESGALETYGIYNAYISGNVLYSNAPDYVFPISSEQEDLNKACILAINNGNPGGYSIETIHVLWVRSDGENLNTSFEIKVTDI